MFTRGPWMLFMRIVSRYSSARRRRDRSSPRQCAWPPPAASERLLPACGPGADLVTWSAIVLMSSYVYGLKCCARLPLVPRALDHVVEMRDHAGRARRRGRSR